MTNPPVPPQPGPPGVGPPPGPGLGPEPGPVVEPGRPMTAEEASRPRPKSAVHFTRTSAVWWSLALGALILILLLVFIAQNLDTTPVHFLGWTWNASVGIAFLISAIGGSLITVIVGGARMLQLRLAARKNLRAGSLPPRARGA